MRWTAVTDQKYEDIRYDHSDGIARITINRPEVRNAFRPETVKELIHAFTHAQLDPDIGVIILTGQGDEAFCSGGDQRVRGEHGGYADEQGVNHLNVLDLQMQIRRLPKPVVAMMAGYAIGGGHVLHLVCDLTIAADNASLRRSPSSSVERLLRPQSLSLSGISNNPKYIIKYLGEWAQNPLALINIGGGYGGQPPGRITSNYRVTARGTGQTGRSFRTVQSYYGIEY